ncbi:B12-binding domain-containing radical SAM protein [Bradyrhizobium japonicum]|uniref:B12-binding domain-containing radical SAM protein n=2 Tax=Bradyrhizobium TaxID=374 RepID=UPI0012FE3800|nr:radical SAM protein [Bradyrhizobium japonicum]
MTLVAAQHPSQNRPGRRSGTIIICQFHRSISQYQFSAGFAWTARYPTFALYARLQIGRFCSALRGTATMAAETALADSECVSIGLQTSHRLRVLFLHPKTLVDSWPVPVDTLGEIVKFPSAVYPVLAATIKDLPVAISILDGYVARISLPEYRERLGWADLLAISCMSPLKALDTELTIKLAREVNPGVKIVVGGNHATAWPERWLAAGVDFVVTGEGEVPFRRLVSALLMGCRSFDHVPNLFWMDSGSCRRSLHTTELIDLESAPPPDWSAFDLKPYGLGMSHGLGAAVEISRGCPHRCDFCNINTFWYYKQRYKSVGKVIAELQALKDAGVGEIIFTDDNFGGDERHAVSLLNEMITTGLDLRFGCFLRGDTIHRNPNFASLAYRAGMRFCMMGIETLDPEWLKAHRKGVRAADPINMYVRVYKILRDQGIFVVGLFILPPATIKIRRTRPTGVVCDYQFSADLVALRGSVLFEKHKESNSISKDMFYHDWNLSSILVGDQIEQRSGKSFIETLKENLSRLALRQAFSGSAVAKRFRWRPVGILIERMVCTTVADVQRFRVSRSRTLTMQQKQDYCVRSVLDPAHISRLKTKRHFLAPLGFRTSKWIGLKLAKHTPAHRKATGENL